MSQEGFVSALYHGMVVHRRLRPRPHLLRYRVFSLFLDLDELAPLARATRGFSYNRFNLFSFHDKDHGPGDGGPLRPWITGHLAAAGIDIGAGAIRVLAYPRILGYVFNPLTVYFCHFPDGRLAATVYEVSNTFGERHSYLIPVQDYDGGVLRQSCAKTFFVSPFISVDARYDFAVCPPTERIAVVIKEFDAGGRLLDASFVGAREPISAAALAKAFWRYPLMTLKVIGGIHWEAWRLWRKGAPLHRRPTPPAAPVTVSAGLPPAA